MPDNIQSVSQDGEGREDSAQESLSIAVQNNPCPKCRAMNIPPPCRGHGGQSEGDSEETADIRDNPSVGSISSQSGTVSNTVLDAAVQAINTISLCTQSQLIRKSFNSEIISDLLSKNIMMIDNNRDSCLCTIKLHCKLNLFSEQGNEFKKYVDIILEELDEFIKEKGISNNCTTIDKDKQGNFRALRISLPTPKLYDEFTQRLASKNLLPKRNIEQNEKVVYEENMNHFNPTPLSMKPSPAINKEEKSIEAEKYVVNTLFQSSLR